MSKPSRRRITNPRPNEIALRELPIEDSPRSNHMRSSSVTTGHIHNYERLEVDGVTYLVSGGGGAHPYGVGRTAADQYSKNADAINFHYIVFRLNGKDSQERCIGILARSGRACAGMADEGQLRRLPPRP